MRYQCSFGWSGLVQTNSLVNLVISASVARLRGYLAPSAVALANVTTEPRARACGRPAATLEIKNIFAAPGERMKLRKSTADGATAPALDSCGRRRIYRIHQLDRQAAAVAAHDLESRLLARLRMLGFHRLIHLNKLNRDKVDQVAGLPPNVIEDRRRPKLSG